MARIDAGKMSSSAKLSNLCCKKKWSNLVVKCQVSRRQPLSPGWQNAGLGAVHTATWCLLSYAPCSWAAGILVLLRPGCRGKLSNPEGQLKLTFGGIQMGAPLTGTSRWAVGSDLEGFWNSCSRVISIPILITHRVLFWLDWSHS